MKRTKLFMMLALAVCALASCSKEDDNQPQQKTEPTQEVTAAQKVAGTFMGWTQADAAYFQGMVTGDVDTLLLTANANATVTATYTSKTWGKAVLDSVVITETSESYSFDGSGIVAMPTRGGELKEYACVMKGSMSNDKSTYNFVVEIQGVMGGTRLTFQQGTTPTGLMLAGSYAGWSSASSAYFQNRNNDGDTIVVTANADGTVNVAYISETWGSGSFEHIAASTEDNGYTLTQTQGTMLIAGMGGNVSSYEAVLTGASISLNKRSYSFEISVPSVMGGVSITFQQGTAPEDE